MTPKEIEIQIQNQPPVPVTELFNELYEPLFIFACNCGAKKEDAKDIAGNAFLKFMLWVKRKEKVFNNKKHVTRALYVILKHCFLDFLKYGNNKAELNEQILETQIDAAQIEQVDREPSLFEKLFEKIVKLPDGQGTIFKMYYLDELSYAEIAERLNIAVNTVKNQLHSARNKLRDS
jgi:RNA polymerase sigma-70 factor (ECF subfamily)